VISPIPVITSDFGGGTLTSYPGSRFWRSGFNLRGGGLKLTLRLKLAVTLLKFTIVKSELFRAGDFATGQIKRACNPAAVFVSGTGNAFAGLTLLLGSTGR
jgi:hypothetical protein